MIVLFEADVPVHYGFINVLGADEDRADLMDARAGQVNGLLGAAVPGQLSLVTGLHTGRVPLVIAWHDTKPLDVLQGLQKVDLLTLHGWFRKRHKLVVNAQLNKYTTIPYLKGSPKANGTVRPT